MPAFQHVGWSLGNYCNARCGHCYSWRVRTSARTLDEAAIARVLDQLVRVGVQTLNLGGNEPFYTHGPNPKDSRLAEIVRAATDRGLTVGVTTNGTTALLLARHAPDAFDRVAEWHVSIDSPVAAEHDRNRGGPYFYLAQTALQLCAEQAVPRTLIYCAMGWNASAAHVDGLFQLARQHGADVRINTVKPTEPGQDELVLSPAQYYRFFREVARWSEPTVVGEPTLAAAWGLPSEGCPCGSRSFRVNSITPEGTVPVSPCVFLHDLRVGDLLTEDLDDLLTRPTFQALQLRRAEGPTDCQGCPALRTCRGGCAARAVLQGAKRDGPLASRLDQPDPYCPERVEGPEAGPLPCALHIPRDRVRVHDGYLCTYIGAPRPEPAFDAVLEPELTPTPLALARPENTVPAAAWRA